MFYIVLLLKIVFLNYPLLGSMTLSCHHLLIYCPNNKYVWNTYGDEQIDTVHYCDY